MIETFAALLFAHALADFVLQSDAMAQEKANGDGSAMRRHIGIVTLTALAALAPPVWAFDATALGRFCWPLALLAGLHLGIDIAKTRAGDRLGPFLADQGAHLASLLLVAWLAPDLWSQGLWSRLPAVPVLMALAAGAIVTVQAGGYATALLLRAFPDPGAQGLPDAGRMIGRLERGLIWLLVLADQTGGVGFLIAAKSVLRFGTVGDDRAASEFIIIGTMASFGWALAASYGTLELLEALGALPLLGIPGKTP